MQPDLVTGSDWSWKSCFAWCFQHFSSRLNILEKVLRNLDHDVCLSSWLPYPSVWKPLIFILHFQNRLNPGRSFANVEVQKCFRLPGCCGDCHWIKTWQFTNLCYLSVWGCLVHWHEIFEYPSLQPGPEVGCKYRLNLKYVLSWLRECSCWVRCLQILLISRTFEVDGYALPGKTTVS